MVIFKTLFSAIDAIVYGFISIVYTFFIEITKTTLIRDELIDGLSNRIMIFVGIFMLFSVAVTLLKSVANPEAIKDKKEGGAVILKRVVITLTLLIMIQPIFTLASRLQNIIIENNVIEKVIMGGAGDQSTIDAGSNMANSVLKGFVTSEDPETQAEIQNTNGALEILGFANDNNVDYKFLISTIAGIIVLFVIISFAIDIIIRVVKLGILKVLAPIPIISYLIPGKGAEILKKWGSMILSTYLSLFIKIAALFLGVYFITEAIGQYEGKPFQTAVIVIGILLFFKQIPQLIYDIFGIKDGGGSLAGMNFLKGALGFGGALAGGVVGGAVVGGAGGLMAGAKALVAGQGLAGAGTAFKQELGNKFGAYGRAGLSNALNVGFKGKEAGQIKNRVRGGDILKREQTGDETALSGFRGIVQRQQRRLNREHAFNVDAASKVGPTDKVKAQQGKINQAMALKSRYSALVSGAKKDLETASDRTAYFDANLDLRSRGAQGFDASEYAKLISKNEMSINGYLYKKDSAGNFITDTAGNLVEDTTAIHSDLSGKTLNVGEQAAIADELVKRETEKLADIKKMEKGEDKK